VAVVELEEEVHVVRQLVSLKEVVKE